MRRHPVEVPLASDGLGPPAVGHVDGSAWPPPSPLPAAAVRPSVLQGNLVLEVGRQIKGSASVWFQDESDSESDEEAGAIYGRQYLGEATWFLYETSLMVSGVVDIFTWQVLQIRAEQRDRLFFGYGRS